MPATGKMFLKKVSRRLLGFQDATHGLLRMENRIIYDRKLLLIFAILRSLLDEFFIKIIIMKSDLTLDGIVNIVDIKMT